jgi:hypothetical protein
MEWISGDRTSREKRGNMLYSLISIVWKGANSIRYDQKWNFKSRHSLSDGTRKAYQFADYSRQGIPLLEHDRTSGHILGGWYSHRSPSI